MPLKNQTNFFLQMRLLKLADVIINIVNKVIFYEIKLTHYIDHINISQSFLILLG